MSDHCGKCGALGWGFSCGCATPPEQEAPTYSYVGSEQCDCSPACGILFHPPAQGEAVPDGLPDVWLSWWRWAEEGTAEHNLLRNALSDLAASQRAHDGLRALYLQTANERDAAIARAEQSRLDAREWQADCAALRREKDELRARAEKAEARCVDLDDKLGDSSAARNHLRHEARVAYAHQQDAERARDEAIRERHAAQFNYGIADGLLAEERAVADNLRAECAALRESLEATLKSLVEFWQSEYQTRNNPRPEEQDHAVALARAALAGTKDG
jgi:hypothetical protein